VRSKGFNFNEKPTDTSWNRTSDLPICCTALCYRGPYAVGAGGFFPLRRKSACNLTSIPTSSHFLSSTYVHICLVFEQSTPRCNKTVCLSQFFQYILGDGKSKWCIIWNFCSKTFMRVKWWWHYTWLCGIGFDYILLHMRCFSTWITSAFLSVERILLLWSCIDSFRILNTWWCESENCFSPHRKSLESESRIGRTWISVLILVMFWRQVYGKKIEKETNTKNSLKILVTVIIRKGLKEINVGNEKRQQRTKKEMQKEEEEKRQ